LLLGRRRPERGSPLLGRRGLDWAGRHGLALAAGAVSLVVLLPLMRPGFVLTYDLASVPRPRLSWDLLGLGRNLPRNVPFGLLIACISRVLPGDIVEKAMLIGIFGGAALGAGRLVPAGTWGRVAGGIAYAWNPFTYERIMLGQAALLLSYAALPWVAASAIRVRRGEAGAIPGLVIGLGAAAFASPYGGIFATSIAALVVASPPSARGEVPAKALGVVVASGAVLNLPWLMPALLHAGGLPSPSIGFDLFRSRSDSPLGLVGSLLSLGGLWRADLAPPGRDGVAWIPAFALLLVVAGVGFASLRAHRSRGAINGLVGAAVVGFVLAVGVAAPGLERVVRWLGENAPGGGLLRDGQKFVAPLALVMAVAFGAGVGRLATAAREQGMARGFAWALMLLPVALAPTLAWGGAGRLFTSRYPSSWFQARQVMSADTAPGAILVLPWHEHLPFACNRNRVVKQPASAFFTRDVVESDALEVGDQVLPPEDPWSALADPIVRGTGPLAPGLPGLGVRYLLLFKEADWRVYEGKPARLEDLIPVLRTPELDLYLSASPVAAPTLPVPAVAPVILGDLLAGGLFLWAAAWALAYRDMGRKGGLMRESADILSSMERTRE